MSNDFISTARITAMTQPLPSRNSALGGVVAVEIAIAEDELKKLNASEADLGLHKSRQSTDDAERRSGRPHHAEYRAVLLHWINDLDQAALCRAATGWRQTFSWRTENVRIGLRCGDT